MEEVISRSSLMLSIEGNTGAGKTTLALILGQELGISVIEEPYPVWQATGSPVSIFDLYIKDPQRWAFAFQSYAFLTFIQAYEKSKNDNDATVFLDRSAYSALYCFGEMLINEHLMTSVEGTIYRKMAEYLLCKSKYVLDGIIYLRTKPETCFARNIKRHRPSSDAIPLSFFEKLHHYHEQWLLGTKPLSQSRPPVLVLDGDVDFVSDTAIQHDYARIVKNFIENLPKRSN